MFSEALGGALAFHPAPAPSDAESRRRSRPSPRRVLRLLVRHGPGNAGARVRRLGDARDGEAVTSLGPRLAHLEGFDLHAMHRAFAIDVLACPHCGGRLRLIATEDEPAVIRKILAHLGMGPLRTEPRPRPT